MQFEDRLLSKNRQKTTANPRGDTHPFHGPPLGVRAGKFEVETVIQHEM